MSTNSQGRTVMVQGRIVWTAGDLFKGSQKLDPNTRQPVIDTRTGQVKMQYGFGLAVPKSVLAQAGKGEPGEIWSAIHEEAYTLYPSRQVPPAFAWKYKDGDGIDHNGAPFAQREGHAGHLVFGCTTSLPIKFYKFEGGQHFLINEGIKCGDYVNVQLSIKAHPAQGQGKPGLYLNPNAVQFLGYGKEIVNAPSAEQIFGNAAPPLPAGASATPIAPAGMIVPPGAPAPYGQPPMAPGYPQGPQGYPQQAPAAPIAPHYGVLPAAHQPAPAPAAPAMPAYPQAAPVPNGYPAPGAAPMTPGAPMGYPAPAAAPAYPSNPGMPAIPQMPTR